MGYCKGCDLIFVIFCFAVFILWANPGAFSNTVNSYQQAHIQAVRNNTVLRREAVKKWDAAIWACINKSFREESDSTIIRHAYHFDTASSTCMDKQWRYDKNDGKSIRYDFTSVNDVSAYSVSGLPDYNLTQSRASLIQN